MFNRLTNVFAESAVSSTENRWQTDGRPALRLTWLGVLMLLPMVAIGVRVAYLQTSTAELFAQPFEQEFVSYESVPSRDGRLLSTDGRVLATDRQKFSVKVHYRWLEEPADPAWLRSQALDRLSKSERRNPKLVAREKEQILAERAAMWNRLSALTGHSPVKLTQERAKIQKRVEGIVALVEKRRRERENPSLIQKVPKDEPAWRRAWESVSRSITAPPSRLEQDPLIIKEEQEYHPLLTGLSLAAVAEIESHPAQYAGLRIDTVSWRDYPEDSLAAHLIGVRKPLTAEEAEKRQAKFAQHDPLGYEVGDRIGEMGLERKYDQHLHGLRGRRKIVRNRRGEIIKTDMVREPRGGSDLMLTLNAGLQERLEQILDLKLVTSSDEKTEEQKPASAGASLVVLDVRTGAVLAAVSAPRFSLMELINPTQDQWQAMNSDPRRPFFHRATHMAVAPGSVFKAVTAVALLESGKFDPDEARHCQGFLDRPDQHRCLTYRHFGVGHGEIDLSRAICRSCNVYFFQGARSIGPGPLAQWAEGFGIGQPTGIDLPGEESGNLPHPPVETAERSRILPASFQEPDARRTPWYPGDTLGLAIGQSRLPATPLQMARVMAAIANDGFLVTPHLVKGFGPATFLNGEPSAAWTTPEPRPIPGLTPGTLARVREGLEMVVGHPQGTGYKTVRMSEVKIAGKTGTAEVGGGLPDHAWFAGYVPADRPKYAFAVVLEHAGSGGATAGPIARRTVETLLELGLVTGRE
jgi:penicillin-binding protein 2